jgi:hypothetical protein
MRHFHLNCAASPVRTTAHFLAVLLAGNTLLLLHSGCGSKEQPAAAQPRFIREVPWIGKGVWLKADTHIHTKFSDGAHTVAEVVQKGEQFGCDVLAITDHADHNLKAATREYHESIEAVRRRHPSLIIFAGLEWNIPPWGGDEHATVLIHPDLDEWSILARFKEQFDDLGRKTHRAELADEALRWLQKQAGAAKARPIVVYEHPSRHDAKSMENVPDMVGWRKVNDLVIGFAGAPGHQRAKPLGSYRYKEKTIDRWDPVAARIGDAWDTLLGQGLDVWAAQAPSDFHNSDPRDLNDYWPGEFSETWLYAPEKTHAGVLEAFRAGTFFAAHGHIARQVQLTVDAPGLPRPAWVGETIELPVGTSFTVKLRCQVPITDWREDVNTIDRIELIAITRESAKIFAKLSPDKEGSVQDDSLQVPAGGIVIRARGRRIIQGGPDLLFYTNPIRIQAGT